MCRAMALLTCVRSSVHDLPFFIYCVNEHYVLFVSVHSVKEIQPSVGLLKSQGLPII